VDPNEITPERIELLGYVLREAMALHCEEAIKNGATDVRRNPGGGYTLTIPFPPEMRKRRRAKQEATAPQGEPPSAPKAVTGQTPDRIDRHGAKRGRSLPPRGAKNRPETSQ